MKAKMAKGGGQMAPKMTKPSESKTSKPVKQAVLSKKDEQSKRMISKPGTHGGRW